jgi:hypothetical protein
MVPFFPEPIFGTPLISLAASIAAFCIAAFFNPIPLFGEILAVFEVFAFGGMLTKADFGGKRT